MNYVQWPRDAFLSSRTQTILPQLPMPYSARKRSRNSAHIGSYHNYTYGVFNVGIGHECWGFGSLLSSIYARLYALRNRASWLPRIGHRDEVDDKEEMLSLIPHYSLLKQTLSVCLLWAINTLRALKSQTWHPHWVPLHILPNPTQDMLPLNCCSSWTVSAGRLDTIVAEELGFLWLILTKIFQRTKLKCHLIRHKGCEQWLPKSPARGSVSFYQWQMEISN